MMKSIEYIAAAAKSDPLAVEGVQLMLREMRRRACAAIEQSKTGWSFLGSVDHSARVMVCIIDEIEEIVESAKAGKGSQ